MHARWLSDLGASLLLAAGAVAITAAVVLATGQLVLPARDGLQDGTGVPTIDDLTGSQAILVLTGDDAGRYALNLVSVGEWNEGTSPDQPLDLSLTFRSHDASMLISARAISADAPATGDAATTNVGVEGANYFGNNGECTITLEDVDYTVLEPQPAVVRDDVPRGIPIPTYAGTVACQGIEEIRSDRQIDLHAVFRFQPQE